MTLLGADAGFKIGSPSAAAASSEPSQMNMSLGESQETCAFAFCDAFAPWRFLAKFTLKECIAPKWNSPLTRIIACRFLNV